jgi:hypothetical protein
LNFELNPFNLQPGAITPPPKKKTSYRYPAQLGVFYVATDLGFKAYEIQLVQVLKPAVLANHHHFSVWALEKFEENLCFQPKFCSAMRPIFCLRLRYVQSLHGQHLITILLNWNSISHTSMVEIPRSVFVNGDLRTDHIGGSYGQYLKDIIFKK